MLITFLKFIFSKFFLFIFFGQIRSQNLKEFKLTETRYRGTLLYPYFNFNVYILKIFVSIFFWPILVSKSEVLQIDMDLVKGYITICLLRF